MSACDFKNIKKSDGNRGVANVVSVVATFPVRLRILRVVCDLCVLFLFFMQPISKPSLPRAILPILIVFTFTLDKFTRIH